mgnify:CR=1 FL=1
MPKILLVEDEKNFGLVLRDYLRMHDLEVDWVENGEEGLLQIKAQKYDLCILDVMMPKKDGFTLGKEIRAIDQQVPLLYLTARGMKEDMLKPGQEVDLSNRENKDSFIRNRNNSIFRAI